jgi:tRNA(fMet)-specific endonuclease VapC
VLTYLVDTDIAIDYLNQQPSAMELLSPKIQAEELGISVISYAELYEGVSGNQQTTARITGLQMFVSAVDVLDADVATAMVFGNVRMRLRSQGLLIADHDLWIAATAIRHDLRLLTRDAHFDRIAELRRG